MISKIETKIFFIILLLMILVLFSFEEIFYKNIKNQFLLCLLPLIWPGLAHGSLDIEIAKRAQLINKKSELFIFLFVYILLAFSLFLLWQIYPQIAFSIFLLLSIYHFGESDSILKLNKKFNSLEIFIRGSLIICLPITLYHEDVANIFTYLNITLYFSEIIYHISMALIILSIFSFILMTLKLERSHNNQKSFWIELILLVFCFTYFEPLISFSLYFCFLHSSRHLLKEKEKLKISFKQLLIKTIPMTLITLILLVTSYSFINFENIEFKYLYITFVSLSCLTVPHMILVNKVNKINRF